MANIMTTVEISQEQGGYYVVVSINGERIQTLGPVPSIDMAEAIQEERVTVVKRVLQDEVKRIREQMNQSAK